MVTSIGETSGQPVGFSKRWHRYFKEAVEPISSAEAKRLDETGQPYVVIVGDPDHPYCLIEVSEGCFGVGFLDEKKREHLRYLFEDGGDGRVFLSEATHREYELESDEVAKGTVYRFSRDGRVQIERAQKPFQQATITDSHMDVSGNWEATPTFGEYEHVIRKDR